MVDEEKVKVMTRLAIYEKGDGKREIPLSKYYKGDYVKYNILKTMIFATISYWLIVACVIVINLEEILKDINNIDYVGLVTKLVVGYAAFLIVYGLITKIVYGIRYNKARPKLIVYNHLLKKLIKFYGDSEKGKFSKMPSELYLDDGREVGEDDHIVKR